MALRVGGGGEDVPLHPPPTFGSNSAGAAFPCDAPPAFSWVMALQGIRMGAFAHNASSVADVLTKQAIYEPTGHDSGGRRRRPEP